MQKAALVVGGALIVGAVFLFVGKGTEDAEPNDFSVGIGESDSGVDITWAEVEAPVRLEIASDMQVGADASSDIPVVDVDPEAESEREDALLGDFFEDNYEDGERQVVGEYRDPLADNPSSGEVQRVGEYKHPDVDGF